MNKFKLSIGKENKYLLGLSGGADSVCLFHLLLNEGFSFDAAHINHGIRGSEADRDEEFCRLLCESHGVALHVLKRDVPALAKASGKSLEDAARDVRYSFFESLMRENSIPVLLTAHNADDNAETLILSLVRGCAPSGACGIPPLRSLEYGEVRRPLLPYSKKQIIAYCNENGYEFVTDSTNLDASYARNRVRLNILPELASLNPEFLEAIARFTNAQREDSEYLGSIASRLAEDADCNAISQAPYPIASRAVAMAAYRAGAFPEAKHIEKMLTMAKEEQGSISLPGSVRAYCDGGRLLFCADTRERKSSSDIYPEYAPIYISEGTVYLPGAEFDVLHSELTNDFTQVHKLSTSTLINLDKINNRLYLRARRAGDRILLGGMHKSLKKLILERLSHLSIEERRALPVLCDGEEIVYVPFIGVSDKYAEGGTHTVIYRLQR